LIARRFNRDEPERDRAQDEPARDGEAEDTGQFALEESHERRILSWSPDPEEDLEPDMVDAEDDPASLVDELEEHAEPVLQVAPAASPLPEPTARAVARAPDPSPRDLDELVEQAAPAEHVTAANPQPSADQEPRRRGRPRGRPRRQVHFHVDPDDELLLLAAAKMHGSQQKGLIAALQALQDNEVLREEIERLRTECERQRVLLADAEAIFNR
jgi:hypothetical protein